MPRYLADASALLRLDRPDVAARLGPLVLAGEVATCGIVDLELLATTRDADAHAALRADQLALPHVALDDATVARAAEVQGRLGRARRDIPVAVLMVAAAAELAGLVLLHDDPRFVQIAAVTQQPVESVVPA